MNLTPADRLYLKYLLKACEEVVSYIDRAYGGYTCFTGDIGVYMDFCTDMKETFPNLVVLENPDYLPFDYSAPFECEVHARRVAKHIKEIL